MDQPTPLLRYGRGLLRLEMLRPHRALEAGGPVEATGNQALAIARPGLEICLRGAVTYEMREALKIWGVRFVQRGERYVPPAIDLEAALVVAPAEDMPILRSLRARKVALVAANEELPDLPLHADLPAEVERAFVTRAEAAAARSRVARELGLLATHAGAAAAVYAHDHGGVALLCAPGEREFSLDSEEGALPPTGGARSAEH